MLIIGYVFAIPLGASMVDSDAKCNATSAQAHQGKARFSFLLRRLPLDFGDAKAAPGKGKSRRFKALRRCTSRRNSGHYAAKCR